MSLREIAEQDLGTIIEDSTHGFGWPITVTNPSGVSASLKGYANDISALIDPDTGQSVSGRLPSVAIRIGALNSASMGLVEGISKSTSKPWLLTFKDINGKDYTFKVAQSNPDRALGIITCILEAYDGT